MRAPSRLLAVVSFVGLGAVPAAAQNLLTNSGFETGTFAGYLVGGTATQYGVAIAGTVVGGTHAVYGRSEVAARSGQFGAYALVCQSRDVLEGCLDGPEVLTLTQTVAVTPGAQYELGLWVGARTPGSGFGVSVQNGFFQLYVDGLGLLGPSPFVLPGDGTFQRVAASFSSGTRASVTVTYALTGSGTGRALLSADDLFVQVVPEPSAVVLLGGGLALAGVVRLRQRWSEGRHRGPRRDLTDAEGRAGRGRGSHWMDPCRTARSPLASSSRLGNTRP
ncbi:PEP-CTERM sorting domain-containing protein [Roseisolibacter agri]|uniref:PEP-CTERM protein-sorting domain-containing protein n=1 Tax=Roseisolibacter agri TaxID=2014610 RepID=A0AA37Q763_9BACT|nr:PEP-CTERM sorting domain-containing protein [Roseisolibacter agri]GLC24977.1 hypothetical protein rosag_14900 [Roseisolibacter agri]